MSQCILHTIHTFRHSSPVSLVILFEVPLTRSNKTLCSSLLVRQTLCMISSSHSTLKVLSHCATEGPWTCDISQYVIRRRDTSVRIVTRLLTQWQEMGVRFPPRARGFSSQRSERFQYPPKFYPMGYGAISSRLRCPGREADYSLASTDEIKNTLH